MGKWSSFTWNDIVLTRGIQQILAVANDCICIALQAPKKKATTKKTTKTASKKKPAATKKKTATKKTTKKATKKTAKA